MTRTLETGFSRTVALAADTWQEQRFFPGRAGRISVAVLPQQAVKIELALARPDGIVVTRLPPAGEAIGTTYLSQEMDLDPARPWILRARGAAAVTVRIEVTFPGGITPIPLAKLNPAVQTALAEAAIRVSLDNQILNVTADRALDGLVAQWRDKPVGEELDGTVIHGLHTKDLALDFLPADSGGIGGWLVLRIGFEDGAKLSKGIGQSFRIRDASITITLGFAVRDGRIELGPVSVKLDADIYDRALLAWLFDVTWGSLRNKVRGSVERAIKKELEGKQVRDALEKLGSWLCRLLNGQALLDLWIDRDQLSVATMPLPRRRVDTPAALARPAPRWPIEHLVVVMMENRSFTHMLGELMAGPRPDFRLPGVAPMPILDAPASAVGVTHRLALRFDPPHSAQAHEHNRAGRWTSPCVDREQDAAMREEVVKYQAIASLPTCALFAEHFCVATQWRSSLSGHTWPNRQYSLSGSSDGHRNNPEGTFDFYDLPTICDVLTAQQVSWGYYKQDVAFLELYRRWTFDDKKIRPYADFKAAIASNTLPTVSWIEPNITDFGAARGSDDHPPTSLIPGQRFLADVYGELRRLASPNWLLVICYDEHGGFYEEVGPVDAPDEFEDCRSTGFRVPAFFVSPLVQARSTYSKSLDHTSIIRTILDAYCHPEPIFERNMRVASARTFIDLVPATAVARAALPAMPPIPESPLPDRLATTSPEWQAFKDRRAQRAEAVRAPEGMPTPTVPEVTARLEAIYVVATSAEARAQLEASLGALKLRATPAFDDRRALFAEPRVEVSIERAWELVHELRGRRDVLVVDPMWETEFGWPKPGPEAEAAAEVDPAWPIALVRAREAWQLSSAHGLSRGEGILVGHIDTGYTLHAELEAGAILDQYGYDFMLDRTDATDPLLEGPLLFPGHGTATASILASRELGAITGTAPAAALIPYRVSRTVVHLSTKRMVAAIRRAVAFGCQVISISAGGLWSAALHRAIHSAHNAGVVIVAAAGNYVPFVVWPALYPEVIACSACNASQTRWQWSSRGRAVDITAPGEAVVVAHASGTTRVSSGTSFATAMVAGAVANWLAFHGRDRLAAMYGAHNLTRVVRDLLARTARPLQGDGSGMGPGILDMHALLSEPLPAPAAYPRFVVESATAPVVDSIVGAHELAAQLELADVARLPLSVRQPLADELLFHRALELARPGRIAEATAAGIPAHASSVLAAALR